MRMIVSSFFPASLMSYPQDREEDGETGIDRNHEEDRFDDRARREFADARRIALDPQAFEAADERNQERVDGRLDEADQQGVDADRALEFAHEGRDRDAEIEIGH